MRKITFKIKNLKKNLKQETIQNHTIKNEKKVFRDIIKLSFYHNLNNLPFTLNRSSVIEMATVFSTNAKFQNSSNKLWLPTLKH